MSVAPDKDVAELWSDDQRSDDQHGIFAHFFFRIANRFEKALDDVLQLLIDDLQVLTR